jgi:hypothetical protein
MNTYFGGSDVTKLSNNWKKNQMENLTDTYLVQLKQTTNFTKHEFEFHQFEELPSVFYTFNFYFYYILYFAQKLISLVLRIFQI